jgi:ssDNA-binding Zn-finger/Zn-ribbon topoisomerase 1
VNEGEEDFLVSYREVRDESLAALVKMGYTPEEGADDATRTDGGGKEKVSAKKEIEPGVFIWVVERPPRPEFQVHLMRRVVSGLTTWDKSFSKARVISYRNPDNVRRSIPRIEEDLRGQLRARCPHCGGPMAERKVKDEKSKNFGKTFLGCLRYPACRGAVAEWMQRAAPDDGKLVGASCPDCGEPLVVRYVKNEDLPHRGQSFIGCSGYPKCRRIISAEELTALRLIGGSHKSLD